MPAAQYTLEDLAQQLDIHPRTIRSYIQQGLLRGPDSMGRNARYSDYHLKRLQVIKSLKEDYGMSLNEIRHQVTMAKTEDDLKIVPSAPKGVVQVQPVLNAAEPSTALDYVRARRSFTETARKKPSPHRLEKWEETQLPLPISSTGPLEKLLVQLREMTRGHHVPRKARGEEWVHLAITPDIVLQVRGQLSQEQLKGFEQLADLMRHILLEE